MQPPRESPGVRWPLFLLCVGLSSCVGSGKLAPDAGAQACFSDHHLEAGQCVPNSRACRIAKGHGRQHWQGGVWTECQLEHCDPPDVLQAGKCVAPAKPQRIKTIAATGAFELVWDWERYNDPRAPQYVFNGPLCTFDNPVHFYRDHSGALFTIAATAVNYRVPMNADFSPARRLGPQDVLFDSGKTYPAPGDRIYHSGGGGSGSCVEADYDAVMWLFGLWTDDGRRFAAVAHHERHGRACPQMHSHWINAIHHLTSSDGARNFLPQAYQPYAQSGKSNANRLVVVPRPEDPSESDFSAYGLFHPSNVVKEGDYHYALVMGSFLTGVDAENYSLHDAGLAMIRSRDPYRPGGWQVFSEAGWQAAGTFVGRGGQLAKLWHRQSDYSPWKTVPTGGSGLSYSLVQQRDSGQWIAFGISHGTNGKTVAYSLSNSLATPNWGPIHHVKGGPVLLAGNYPSLVDHDASDYVFQSVGRRVYMYAVIPNSDRRLVPAIGQPVTSVHSRSVWRMPVEIELAEK